MARGALVRAVSNFACEVDGTEHLVHQGQVFPTSHPVVKARKELFVPERSVEEATATPGEKRKR
jgi:hypothetical protein